MTDKNTGTWEFGDERVRYTLKDLGGGEYYLEGRGYDYGASLKMHAVLEDLARLNKPVQVYVDLTDLNGATWDVSHRWAAWMRENKESIRKITFLVGSRFMHLTVAVARELSKLGNRIVILTDRALFNLKLPAAPAEPKWYSGPIDLAGSGV